VYQQVDRLAGVVIKSDDIYEPYDWTTFSLHYVPSSQIIHAFLSDRYYIRYSYHYARSPHSIQFTAKDAEDKKKEKSERDDEAKRATANMKCDNNDNYKERK